jgi:hypothetical protein
MQIRLKTKTGIRKYNIRTKSNYYYDEKARAFERIDENKTYAIKEDGISKTVTGERLRLFKRHKGGSYTREHKRIDIPKRVRKDMMLGQHYILYAKATCTFKGKKYKLEAWSFLVKRDEAPKSYKQALEEVKMNLVKNLAWQSQDRSAYDRGASQIRITKVKVSHVIS